MENRIELAEELLNRQISGFHQYILSEPIRLSFVSENLCEMTGYSRQELLGEGEDRYTALVYPADRERYCQALLALSRGEPSLTVQYRIVKKNGAVCHVSDALTAGRREDGTPVASSVLTDVTRLKTENENLRFLNETIPCGFLKYTCEKQPKVTYINQRMLDILRIPEVKDGELDYRELYQDNIYLMIPMEERGRFARYLERVCTQGAPIAGDMTVLRCDGTRAHLFGWVTKSTNEQGVEEFQSVCMDITEKHHQKKEKQEQQYLKALTDVYDKIFEYDFSNGTVKCLYGQRSGVFKWIENIPMQMEEATEQWIIGAVWEEDRDRVRDFFHAFYRKRLAESGGQPPRIRYRALSSAGRLNNYEGIFLKIDSGVSLLCCRTVADPLEASLLRSENVSLRSMNENMQELVKHFTEGLAAFEVRDDLVTPLYSSDNICQFFGFARDEWLQMMKKSTPVKDFVARSGVAYEAFVELLANGEAEFSYYDLQMQAQRRIKAICSRKSPDGSAPRYVMLYNVDEKERRAAEQPRVYLRTFGYFDVFVDDKPIAFRNEKSKELFALLADRRGGYVSSEEAISFLWEEEPVNSVTLARYRKVALRLKNLLEEYGISEVVESVNGKRRIVTDKVRCDLYDYLSGDEGYSQLFKGSYLTNYSWGETTLGELNGEHTRQ